jgi:hypothetical protein
MLERTQTRALPLINKGVGITPAAQVCCGACRTCLTANVFAFAAAAISGAAVHVVRLFKREN